jgi:hypothetical protein
VQVGSLQVPNIVADRDSYTLLTNCLLPTYRCIRWVQPPEPFEWYDFPEEAEGSKWKVLAASKTVHVNCLIDALAKKLTPPCTGTASCKQKLPSGGHYQLCFFDCFFETLLGSGWQNGTTSPAAGANATHMPQVLTAAFDACPAAA